MYSTLSCASHVFPLMALFGLAAAPLSRCDCRQTLLTSGVPAHSSVPQLCMHSFSVVPAECIAGNRLGFYLELLATLLMPILCAFALFAMVWLLDFRDRRQRKRSAYWGPLLVRLHMNPRVYKVFTWMMLLMYPSIARKSLSVFDCLPAGEGDEGDMHYLLRDDPAIQCFTSEWQQWAYISVSGIVVFCLVLPLIGLTAAWSYHRGSRDNLIQRERIILLVGPYEDKYWFCELAVLMHRFVFTGIIHIIYPETRLQLFAGVLCALFTYVVFLFTRPFKHPLCDMIQAAVLLQLLLTYVSALLFFESSGGSSADSEVQAWRDSPVVGACLIAANSICFVLLSGAFVVDMLRANEKAYHGRLRYARNDALARASPLAANAHYHLFLSHTWATGQEQMAILRSQLLLMLPDLKIFLDVDTDELDLSSLEMYIDESQAVLVFCSNGYFSSRNCMRELRRSAARGKKLIAMLQPDQKKGGLLVAQVQQQLVDADEIYGRWGFDDSGPRSKQLFQALFAEQPLEWSSVTLFQQVTARILATHVIPPREDGAAPDVYVLAERQRLAHAQQVQSPRQGCDFHLYVSSSNSGAASLVTEVNSYLSRRKRTSFGGSRQHGAGLVKDTSNPARFDACEAMLLLLDQRTWSSGRSSTRLAVEVARALIAGLPLILVHEMPGLGQDARHACTFDTFFNEAQTPVVLIRSGIYGQVAVPFKGGAWRETSIVMLVQKLCRPAPAGRPLSKRAVIYLEQLIADADARAVDDASTGIRNSHSGSSVFRVGHMLSRLARRRSQLGSGTHSGSCSTSTTATELPSSPTNQIQVQRHGQTKLSHQGNQTRRSHLEEGGREMAMVEAPPSHRDLHGQPARSHRKAPAPSLPETCERNSEIAQGRNEPELLHASPSASAHTSCVVTHLPTGTSHDLAAPASTMSTTDEIQAALTRPSVAEYLLLPTQLPPTAQLQPDLITLPASSQSALEA